MHKISLSAQLWVAFFLSRNCAGQNNLVVRAPTASPSPISIAPSQNWDGDYGKWSTFTLRIGTPEQDVRVLISTASPETWVVLPEGCAPNDSSCKDGRGQIFSPNESSTWQNYGTFGLDSESNLGLSGNGKFGNDTLGLGVQGSGGPTLQHQIVGGIATDNFFVGMFGVNPAPTNISSMGGDHPSYMSSLKNQSLIPSLSIGYTAGAPYRLKKVLGSLTLGGYDLSRFNPNPLSFKFAPDNSRDIVVGIQSITSVSQKGGTHNLLPSGILAYVDSTVSEIWLPLEACQAFENAFGLTYNETSELYPVNDTLHRTLLDQNANVSFVLGNTQSGGDTITITLPYASFDLLASWPAVDSNTKYFPLKRANNDTQNTLGRTFLQEAYLTVDWERGNFSISQCIFNDNAQEQLVAIPSADAPLKSSSGISTGAIVGIVIGVLVVLGTAIAAALYMRHMKKRRLAAEIAKHKDDLSDDIRKGYGKAELDTDLNERFEMPGHPPQPVVLDSSGNAWIEEKSRFPGDRSAVTELKGSEANVAELKSDPRVPHEMFDPSAAVELPADAPRELPGSTPSASNGSTAISSPTFRSANQSPVYRSQGPSPLDSAAATNPTTTNRSSALNTAAASSPTRSPVSQASSPPSRPSGAPLMPNRTESASSRGDAVFSPISPINEERHESPGMFSMLRGLSQPRSSKYSSLADQSSSRRGSETEPPKRDDVF